MSTTIIPQQPTTGPLTAGPSVNPFRIGWRDVVRTLPDGSMEVEQIPLTAEDCLHPQPGDVIVENSLHSRIRGYLHYVLSTRFEHDQSVLVLSDTPVYWDEPALRHHSPDITVIFDVRENRERWDSFYVAEQGTRPRLIIEIVSEATRDNDVDIKLRQYHQANVAFYSVIDLLDNKWKLTGYRAGPKKYVPIPPDGSGLLWLEPVGLWLGLKGSAVAFYDGKTGMEVGDYSMVTKERDAAAAERDAADARAVAAEERIRELEEQLKRKS